MIDIFKKIKIRRLILLYIMFFIIMVFIKLMYNLSTHSLLVLTKILTIVWIIFMIFRHKNSYKFNLSGINTKNVKIDILKVLTYHIINSLAINCIVTAIIYIVKPSWMGDVLNATPLGSNMYMNFIEAVIIAPILEELIFRGIIFSRLSERWGYVFAAIISSVIFGILHIEMAIIGAVILGICQCVLFKKYNNIIIPMIVHFLNNFVAFVILIFCNLIENSEENQVINDIVVSNSDIVINLVLGIILIIPSSILIIKYIKNNSLNKEQHLLCENNIVN